MEANRLHHSGQVSAASGLDVLAGIWLIISPWALHFSSLSTTTANAVVLGVVIACLALSRFFGGAGPWASWVNFALGIWVLISPWVLTYAIYATPRQNAVLMGIIVLILGFWCAVAGSYSDTSGTNVSGPVT
jgi:hypothetical protein